MCRLRRRVVKVKRRDDVFMMNVSKVVWESDAFLVWIMFMSV